MKLTILGSGTCVPYIHRGSSGYALETRDSKLLLDCGSGSTWKLAHAGINYMEINHIFISHMHPDHTGDLTAFLFASKYAYWSPYGEKREKALRLWGGQGFEEFFTNLKRAYNEWIVPDGLEVTEIEPGSFDAGDLMITAVKTPHIDSSLAYRIDAQGKSIVYSGDTDYSKALIELSQNVDLLIIECALPDEHKRKGHLTPSEVVKITNASGAKRIVVTHLYPVSDEERVVETIRAEVDAQVIEAEDLLQIEV
jgi:ribonuclease BN (tRNA processing enzyme)